MKILNHVHINVVRKFGHMGAWVAPSLPQNLFNVALKSYSQNCCFKLTDNTTMILTNYF